jgi:hypothetical protein
MLHVAVMEGNLEVNYKRRMVIVQYDLAEGCFRFV